MGFDLIGDIHGEAPSLTALLSELGYRQTSNGFAHDGNRKAIFVGDLVDRGAWERETIEIVRAMMDSGNAQCVMGNHEFNAIAYGTIGANGKPLREHSKKNVQQHEAFIRAYEGDPVGYSEILSWFKTLPMWIELPGLRVVHACWDQNQVDFLEDRYQNPYLTDELLVRACTFGTREHYALEVLLKGKETALPEGAFYYDKEGTRRTVMRTRWWGKLGTYKECYMGPEEARENIPDIPMPQDALVQYAENAPPVFIGHYWLDGPPEPLAHNIGCLDYSVAKPGGSLVAYRFDGEKHLQIDKFVSVPRAEIENI